mmetsp:Transcript_13553/g.38574  ORF Transcript_13553/g.38574 Transcript_13553/m.38574 type:complete len:234 (+) Transcript_13553:363-1064(+)
MDGERHSVEDRRQLLGGPTAPQRLAVLRRIRRRLHNPPEDRDNDREARLEAEGLLPGSHPRCRGVQAKRALCEPPRAGRLAPGGGLRASLRRVQSAVGREARQPMEDPRSRGEGSRGLDVLESLGVTLRQRWRYRSCGFFRGYAHCPERDLQDCLAIGGSPRGVVSRPPGKDDLQRPLPQRRGRSRGAWSPRLPRDLNNLLELRGCQRARSRDGGRSRSAAQRRCAGACFQKL